MRSQYNSNKSITDREYQEYTNFNIFTPSEIQNIQTSRSNFTDRLSKSPKTLLPYIKYIQYECKLQKIIRKRLKSEIKTSRISNYTKSKIIYLYRKCIFNSIHNKNDLPSILKSFSEYCFKFPDLFDILKDVLRQICVKLPNDVDLFVFSSKICLSNNDFESARSFILKCMRFNPNLVFYNSVLYFCLFEIEVCKCLYWNEMCKDVVGLVNLNNDDNFGQLNGENKVCYENEDKINGESGMVDDPYGCAYNVFEELYRISPESNEINDMIEMASQLPILKDRIDKLVKLSSNA